GRVCEPCQAGRTPDHRRRHDGGAHPGSGCVRGGRRPPRGKQRRNGDFHSAWISVSYCEWFIDELSSTPIEFAHPGERICQPGRSFGRIRSCSHEKLSILQLRRLHVPDLSNRKPSFESRLSPVDHYTCPISH